MVVKTTIENLTNAKEYRLDYILYMMRKDAWEFSSQPNVDLLVASRENNRLLVPLLFSMVNI